MEAIAATKALEQHKKRANWKQNRYRTRRANAAASQHDERLYSVKAKPLPIGIHKKEEAPENDMSPSHDSSHTSGMCGCDVKWTIQALQSVDNYSALLTEIRAHGLKSRKDKSSMINVLGAHYLDEHGSRPLRGVKRKLPNTD